MKNKLEKISGRQPLVSIAYGKIYKRIICMEYKPGQPLQEKVLCDQLEIGRTPIREALFLLSNEHLVEFKPQAGFIVKPINLGSVKSMFKALRLYESGVAQLTMMEDLSDYLETMIEAHEATKEAIEKRDVYSLVLSNHEYHMAFTRCSRNEFLIKAMHEVRCEANRMAYLSFSQEFGANSDDGEHYQSVVLEHEQLIESLKKRDLERMESVISQHIQNFQSRIVNYLTS